MSKSTRYLGLDVHAETISAALAQGRTPVQNLGQVQNRTGAIKKLIDKAGGPSGLRVCYEAGPTGYALYWELTRLGVDCEVIAPSLIPKKSGDRVKTDRRDAEKLAEFYRAGVLTPVWVPDAEHEALRDLVRARSAAKKDEVRAKNRLLKYLLRNGIRGPENRRAFGSRWWEWMRGVQLEYEAQSITLQDLVSEVDRLGERTKRLDGAIDDAIEASSPERKAVIDALQALRGVARLTAVTIATEIGTFRRFDKATRLMAYAGLVPSEHSSGARNFKGGITHAGNSALRHVLGEAAWQYRHRPYMGERLKKQQGQLSSEINDIAWKAQNRLYRKHRRLTNHGKPCGKVGSAIARELVGFVWAIGYAAETRASRAST